jgi:uncharacterized protein (UPF0548 family)
VIDDFGWQRTRANLEERLASAGPDLAEILRAALEAGEGTDAWQQAEFALGTTTP